VGLFPKRNISWIDLFVEFEFGLGCFVQELIFGYLKTEKYAFFRNYDMI
jgi:hypothetical protein